MTDTPRTPTTITGAPVESDEHSLTIGTNGPIVLHDHYLIEQMATFNRERVVRTADTLRAEDDDWDRARALVREVMGGAERDRLVSNVVGHLLDGVSEPVLQRAYEYWRNTDPDLGGRIEKGVRR